MVQTRVDNVTKEYTTIEDALRALPLTPDDAEFYGDKLSWTVAPGIRVMLDMDGSWKVRTPQGEWTRAGFVKWEDMQDRETE